MEGNPIPSFDEDLLIKLCEDAAQIFMKEDNVIEVNGDLIVVGDIHGSFHDLLRIIHYIKKNNSKVIFLGDYVDRGNFSLECITLLFSLKILNPDTVFLLRGNHEFNEMCSYYGFKKEILNYHNPKKCIKDDAEIVKPRIADEDYLNFNLEENDKKQVDSTEDSYFADHININCYKYHKKLYDAFMKTFSYLPICAIANKNSICLHGGLTPLLNSVDNIRNQIKRPIIEFNENELLSDITWGDPRDNSVHLYGENQRGKGKTFSGPALINFLKNNNLKRLIRGHEYVEDGIEELFNSKCITVFSASSYSSDMGNSCGILKLFEKDDEVEPIIFPPLKRLKKCDTNYYRVQSYASKYLKKSNLFNSKFGSLLSFSQVSFDNVNCHHFLSSRKLSNFDEQENVQFQKVHQFGLEHQKRFCCTVTGPHIFVPHVNKN